MRADAKIVKVETSMPYEVIIGRSIYGRVAELIPTGAEVAAIVCDSNVAGLYLPLVEGVVNAKGITTCSYILPGGEEIKNLNTVGAILAFLEENKLSRTDVVIALGGGVTGDIAGFCASIYLRGISFIQMPTTLLAAVDSSVGGKTGVNTVGGKNQVGAFWQPASVVCDCDFLDSLPHGIYADGMAEVIKYGVIADSGLLDPTIDIVNMIYRCVSIKSAIVSSDERDKGERQKLNFGHTAGHAIEKASGYSISHGKAVAMGMVIAARMAVLLGVSEYDCRPQIITALNHWGLPTETDFVATELLDSLLADKKRSGGEITLVLPVRISKCVLCKLPISQLGSIIDEAMMGAEL